MLKIYGSTGSIEHVIEAGSDKTHRIEVTPDGAKLYPENEEDTFSSVIDLKARKRIKKIFAAAALITIEASKIGR